MRGITICNIRRRGSFSLGVRTPGGILDVAAAAKARRVRAPMTTDEVIRGTELAGLRRILAAKTTAAFLVPEAKAVFGPCVLSPGKLLLMGLNYRRHAAEVKLPLPETPTFFSKFNNTLLGHGGVIELPKSESSKFDYEAELVIVIGKKAQRVPPEAALACVFGYATGNDFSARDLQFKTSQWLLGKTCDGFAPLGPWLVSADLVKDPQNLAVRCSVNGEVRQSSNTSDMIFSCAQLISYASRHMTLLPGDVIFTGTPEGVIQGKPEAERVWLKAGDQLATEIEGLGELRFSLA
ncbi:MAG TPA: fumarylacetoacetate hydrolase family protein [Myxococcales bacterium]|nr:fumarylacetoacetate hydrolase family protein [Myxococcales bacterium]